MIYREYNKLRWSDIDDRYFKTFDEQDYIGLSSMGMAYADFGGQSGGEVFFFPPAEFKPTNRGLSKDKKVEISMWKQK